MYFEILEVVLSVYLLIYGAIHHKHNEYLERVTDEIMLTACSSLVYILKFELYIQNKYIYIYVCVSVCNLNGATQHCYLLYVCAKGTFISS